MKKLLRPTTTKPVFHCGKAVSSNVFPEHAEGLWSKVRSGWPG